MTCHTLGKMAVILLSSDLNKRRGCLLYKYEKEVDSESPFDVEILENPTNSKKMKQLHVLDDSKAVCWGLVLKCYELRTRQHRKC
jgi:sentrin-specific protease 1